MVITLGMVALAMFCALTAVVVGLRQRPEKVPVPPVLLALELAHFGVEGLRSVLDHDRPRVGHEVVVPDRVLRGAALGGHE